MKRHESFNIKYKGELLHQNLSYEQSTEVLEELAQKYYDGEDIDPSFIELEKI
jgi:NOL1/NOP2/fmu family ribosome biogenesis protein